MVANTVADPGTMVVHFGHANVTNAAVVRALWLPIPTSLAIKFLVRRRRLWNYLGSLDCCDSIGEKSHEDKEIEKDFD